MPAWRDIPKFQRPYLRRHEDLMMYLEEQEGSDLFENVMDKFKAARDQVLHIAERAETKLDIEGSGPTRKINLTREGKEYLDDLADGFALEPAPSKSKLGICSVPEVWKKMTSFTRRPGGSGLRGRETLVEVAPGQQITLQFRTPNLKDISEECSEDYKIPDSAVATFLVVNDLYDTIIERSRRMRFRDPKNKQRYDREMLLNTCSWLDIDYNHRFRPPASFKNVYGIAGSQVNYWKKLCNISVRPPGRRRGAYAMRYQERV